MSEHANETLLRRAVELFSQWTPARIDASYAPEAVVHAFGEETRDSAGASAAGGEIEGPVNEALWFVMGGVTFLVLSSIGTSVLYALATSR